MNLLITSCIACSYEPVTIGGRVVDESGAPLINVNVQACYSGWGLSGGKLVWDKNYCSDVTMTDQGGQYNIYLEGAPRARLTAWKEGWVQSRDYDTMQPLIVLTRIEDYRSRLKAEAMRLELEHRQPLPDESLTDYYCRVILQKVHPVNLNYQDEKLSVTPVLLVNSPGNEMIFSVRGSTGAVNSISDEAVIKINNEISGSTFIIKPIGRSCGSDIHFIGVHFRRLDPLPDSRVEILISSISAMFDMKIWKR